jgi:hypothetical protein
MARNVIVNDLDFCPVLGGRACYDAASAQLKRVATAKEDEP